MAVGEISVAAATAVVGYDLFQNQNWQVTSYPRVLTGIGMAGSAAALDTEVDLIVDGIRHGNFFNTATGAVLMDAHRREIEVEVAAGAKVSLIVKDAPGTNPINVVLEWEE